MSTQIQFLRTDQSQLRPDPNVLANGMPLLNFNEQEPGLFFKARDGSLFKVGPTAVGGLAPNSGANGYAGNTVGEMWLDTSGAVAELKVYDGADWVIPGAGDTRVSSVGLSMPPSIFDVEGTPITTAGTFDVNLQPQARNRFLGGPTEGSAQIPTFRALAGDDIPGLDATKVVSGLFNQARIPSLDATKITSGVFNSARIPGIDATKIISGVLPYSFGGTGVGAYPGPGELLIGGMSTGWNKTTLTAGPAIGITNGAGNITLRVSPPGAGGEVMFNNQGSLGADSSFSYDGVSNTLQLDGQLWLRSGTGLRLRESGGTPTPALFESGNGNAITLRAPTSGIAAPYTLVLPPSIPGTSAENILKVSGSGTLSFTDSVTLNNLDVRDTLAVQNSSTGFETRVRAGSGLASNLDLTLPTSYGASGGYLKTDPSGVLSVSENVSAPIVEPGQLRMISSSPSRTFISDVASLAVSSNGTYNLIEITANGSPASVSFTVFVHDESAAIGTGTLTVSYNAHYNGSAAVLSAAGNKVDSWTGTEPTFAATYSGGVLMVQTTTASGSNQLRFMVDYTYVINVSPT
jgi:hypothetical protein